MGKIKTSICNVSVLIFILFAITAVLDRNDFFGEILDTKNVKSIIKKDVNYQKSYIYTDKSAKSQFRRFDLSSLVAIKKMKTEIGKFEIVKALNKNVNNELKGSKVIFYFLILLSLIAIVINTINRKLLVVLGSNIVLTFFLFLYDLSLIKAVKNLGLEKSIFQSWGVAESIQHFCIFALFLILLFAFIFALIVDTKIITKKVPNNSIDHIKKTSKMILTQIFKNKFSYYMLAPAIIVVLLIIVYPFLYNFRISFSNLNLKRLVSFIKGDKLYYNGIDNYLSIFSDILFWKVFLRTIIWTFSNIFFHVIGGVFLALMLNRENMKMRPFYQTLLILPWAIPQFIAVLVWRGMFNTRYGAINLFLTKFAQIFTPWAKVEIPWLTDPFWLFTGAIITNIWLGIPFMMMIALGGLQSIPETYYEAAEIDGAGSIGKIIHITIPQLKPVMTPAIIMGIVWTFNNLNVIYLLSTDTLTGKVDILVTYVYKAAFNLYRYGYAAAFSAIIFGILMVFSIFMIKATKVEEGVR